MDIRRAAPADVPAILEIFRIAKAYMAAHGNAGQWGGDYPGLPELLPDIARVHSYVLTDGGVIVGTFSFIIGDEPTYRVLLNGHWHADRPYGTIHRLASKGTAHGVAGPVFPSASASWTMSASTPMKTIIPCSLPSPATVSVNAAISMPPTAPCARRMISSGHKRCK